MKNYFIDKKDSALLVIDIQEKLFKIMDEKAADLMIKNSSLLIETSKVFSMPVLITEQYRKGLGPTIKSIQDKAGNIALLEKTTFDCMKEKSITDAVKALDKKTFIICGIESHVCVLQTALSLLNSGYKVIIASDAVMSRRKSDWKTAMKVLSDAGAVIYSAESIAFMIIEDSANPEFKKLAHLFK